MNHSLLTYILIFILLLSCNIVADDTIPKPLHPWQSWVLKGSEAMACPFINRTDFSKANNHICAWSGTLTLKVKNKSASFHQPWQVLSKSIILLPGSKKNWPLFVNVNNKEVPVFSYQDQPAIILEKGNFVITGKFLWQNIPNNIRVPKQYAVINMTINGQAVPFPKIEKQQLWLQAFEENQTVKNTIDITVARRLVDGAYMQLDTVIHLNVSGQMREIKLGEVLPEGFSLIAVKSAIPSFLDGEGVLHAKLKPGSWQIKVQAYAQPTVLSWQRPQLSHLWPKDEIWVFQSNEKLRLGKIEGVKVVDTSQATMPASWYQLPGYLVKADDKIIYQVQHRGKPLHIENQLTLHRTLWLAFDNTFYTFNDNIYGTMITDWRLSMQAPYLLQSADDNDGATLVTSHHLDERGVENRYPAVNIQARGTINAQQQLPVTGWQNNFERVSVDLHLPPGNKLLMVLGADHVSNSWWHGWTIWTCFIVLLMTMVAGRVFGLALGLCTLVMMLLIYQESGVPILLMINLLLAIVIKKYQPFKKIVPIINLYWSLAILLAVSAILFFSVNQIRTVIYPQLEVAEVSSSRHFSKNNNLASAVMERSKEYLDEAEMVVSSSKQAIKQNTVLERYQADALLQAGTGIPNWQWHSSKIQWNSPVATDQKFSVIVLSRTIYGLIKMLGILLILGWLYLLLKETINFSKLMPKSLKKPDIIASVLLLSVLVPGLSFDAKATNFPDKVFLTQLKNRLLEAPLCAPDCLTINQLDVNADKQILTLSMSIHASADTAFALPRSEFWQPAKFFVNQKPLTKLYKKQGWNYLPITKGISRLEISGRIAPVDMFQLAFKDKPRYMTIHSSSFWAIVGSQANVLNGNTLEFLKTNVQNSSESSVSSRYSSQPFVEITRELFFEQLWKVRTKVKRIAPINGSINIKVPTLTGENIISEDIVVNNDMVTVTMPAGANHVNWQSTLPRKNQWQLHAQAESSFIEHWRLVVSPTWHVELSGLPLILEEQSNSHYFSYNFYPYPGESLNFNITRPEAVKGDVLAIDSVNYHVEQGTRTTVLSLDLQYRSTRGGEHIIELPQSYQLKEINADNKLINLQMDEGKLTIPIMAGKHNVSIKMRTSNVNDMLLHFPKINLNAPVSNINSKLDLSRQQWILWVKGPLLGPAVLYWGELLAFIFVALLMSKVKFSPLNTVHWIMLGFGLSLNNWSVLMVLAFWFASITASEYRPKTLTRLGYNFSQFLLYGLSLVAIFSLISVIPMSLLGSPDMGITGNGSGGNHLSWFLDQSGGVLPQISVLSINTIFYKVIMLLWVIWLCFSCLSWIRWAWKKLGEQGYWQSTQKD